ncbi:GFA family protein [Algicella marina]|uniref:GFA family protein n=1 Tax=Algicella marina TaxID=2683284 RepID=A0A6P1T4B1_9RHOB|nr:GFA family protein [Algicella marina]QHQ36533.1 GFA family protein [Algicella marina]
MSDIRTGRCLCGSVTLRIAVQGGGVSACHCSQCRRWTGGGPLYSIRADVLETTGEAAIASYRHSGWGERTFCGTCGTTLYWRMQGRPVAYVAPGLLDDQDGLTMESEIFVDQRAPWMQLVDGTSRTTEAEELAELEAFLEKEKADG